MAFTVGSALALDDRHQKGTVVLLPFSSPPQIQNKRSHTHFAFVKIGYDFLVQLLLQLLLGVYIVAVPLKQVGHTGLVRPLKANERD